MQGTDGLPWNLYVELRKEILATQQLRSRAIEFKITVIGAALGLFVANLDKIADHRVLVLPAFAGVFFDFLIVSYNFGIKRQSHYLRDCVEPLIRNDFPWRADVPLWEKHVSDRPQRQPFSIVGNLGLTLVASLPGAYVLLQPPLKVTNLSLFLLLLLLLILLARIYSGLGYYTNWPFLGHTRQHSSDAINSRSEKSQTEIP